MKNKMTKITIAIVLTLFSFYYTNKSIDIVKYTDPIMKQIKKSSAKYEITPTSAKIKDNTIIPGLSGKMIDVRTSYDKMKEYGMYNESLTTLKEVAPTVSLDDNYDKYIISGNETKKEVALIFKINAIEELKTLANYFDKKEVSVTFFIRDNLLDENSAYLKTLNNYEIELIFDKVSDLNVSSSSNYFYNITSKNNKYCYSEEKDEKLLSICKKHHLHTIIPNIIVKTSSIETLRKKLSNGAIISFEYGMETRNNLDYLIKYIKQKGYSFKTLDKLLKE